MEVSFIVWMIIMIIIFGALIFLQIFLSRMQSWLPGAILLLVAALITRSLPLMIPLIVIYIICRRRHKKRVENLDKMNIQDL